MTEPALVTPQRNPRSRDNLLSATFPNASQPGKKPAASKTTVATPQQHPGIKAQALFGYCFCTCLPGSCISSSRPQKSKAQPAWGLRQREKSEGRRRIKGQQFVGFQEGDNYRTVKSSQAPKGTSARTQEEVSIHTSLQTGFRIMQWTFMAHTMATVQNYITQVLTKRFGLQQPSMLPAEEPCSMHHRPSRRAVLLPKHFLAGRRCLESLSVLWALTYIANEVVSTVWFPSDHS